MAGPDPLEAGVAYKLALPPSRHDALKDFRVLVVDTHPILSPNREVRESIEKLVGNLEKARATVARQRLAVARFRGILAPLYANGAGGFCLVLAR